MVGTAGALALLTRSIGVAGVAGVVCFLLARRVHYSGLVGVVVPVLFAALAWGSWVAVHARGIDPALSLNYGTYLSPVSQAGLTAVRTNLRDMSRPLAVLAVGWIPLRWLDNLLPTPALGLGLYALGF